MGFLKYFPVFATLFLASVLVKQSAVADGLLDVVYSLLGLDNEPEYIPVLEYYYPVLIPVNNTPTPIKLSDGDALLYETMQAINKLNTFAQERQKCGPIGNVMSTYTDGFGDTMKLVGVGLNGSIDFLDNFLAEEIKNKAIAFDRNRMGFTKVRADIYYSGASVHRAIGAVKSVVNIPDKKEIRDAIEKIQQTGTGLFDFLDVAEELIEEAIKSDDLMARQKLLAASHAIMRAASSLCNNNFLAGGIKAISYLFLNNEAEITTPEDNNQYEFYAKAKQAALADSYIVWTMNELEKYFDALYVKNQNVMVNKIKGGLLRYITTFALAISDINDFTSKLTNVPDNQKKSAANKLDECIENAKQTIIEGSVDFYEVLGFASIETKMLEPFKEAIEVVELSRVEGTNAFDRSKVIAKRGVLSSSETLASCIHATKLVNQASVACFLKQMYNVKDILIKAMSKA